MKFRMKKITALMAAAVLGASTFGGVSVMAAESTEAMSRLLPFPRIKYGISA